MSQERPDSALKLAANIIFTQDGANIVGQREVLKKVKNRDGYVKEGIFATSFKALTIQKMILHGFIDEIYIRQADLLSSRKEIISLNNLILYAILYKKLSPVLADMIFGSDVMKEFNRKNPRNSIISLKHISQDRVGNFFTKNQKLFNETKEQIYQTLMLKIQSDPVLEEEDKIIRLKSIDKFIDWIDKRIWYLYFIVFQTNLKEEMEEKFVDTIYKYLDHTQIATHMSSLMMEFIQNAEKAHFERIILRNKLAVDRSQVDAIIRDAGSRQNIIDIAHDTDQMLELSWSLNQERSNIGKQYRISINISNFGLIDEVSRHELSQKMKTDVEGISLSDFYQDNDDPLKLGAGLGLLYNSYLEDICRKKRLAYSCNIFPETRKEKTTVQISITL